MDNNEIIKSNRQPKNLKHSLTNAKFTDNTTEIPKPKVSKRGRATCGICEIIHEGPSFRLKNGPLFYELLQ